MYAIPRITLAMFIMVLVRVVRGLWGSSFSPFSYHFPDESKIHALAIFPPKLERLSTRFLRPPPSGALQGASDRAS